MCNAQLRNLESLRASTFSAQPAPKPEEAAPVSETYEDASSDPDLAVASEPDFVDGEVDATQAFTL